MRNNDGETALRPENSWCSSVLSRLISAGAEQRLFNNVYLVQGPRTENVLYNKCEQALLVILLFIMRTNPRNNGIAILV